MEVNRQCHVNISAVRRKCIVGHFNKDLHSPVEEPERCVPAAPFLFGKDFEKLAKAHMESVRSSRCLVTPTAFFDMAAPSKLFAGVVLTPGAVAEEKGVFTPSSEGEQPAKVGNQQTRL